MAHLRGAGWLERARRAQEELSKDCMFNSFLNPPNALLGGSETSSELQNELDLPIDRLHSPLYYTLHSQKQFQMLSLKTKYDFQVSTTCFIYFPTIYIMPSLENKLECCLAYTSGALSAKMKIGRALSANKKVGRALLSKKKFERAQAQERNLELSNDSDVTQPLSHFQLIFSCIFSQLIKYKSNIRNMS